MAPSNSSDQVTLPRRIGIRIPVIFLIFAASAVPVEFRSLDRAAFDWGFYPADIAANIAVYTALGLVIGELGLLRAAVVAAFLSGFAEAGQFAMMHRVPSVIDFASDVLGAIVGAAVVARWGIPAPELRIGKWRALGAATLALGLLWGASTQFYALNTRGTTSPGTLEAHWKFDEGGGGLALDSSGHGLNGRFREHPKRGPGVLGGGVTLDGATDSIAIGRATELQLTGSMTVSAWINSSSFPADDAAIVSAHTGLGYQLDTTVDSGPRTIGFKLGNACGELMARYGATPLTTGVWNHVAGVYNAQARTLDVYLNGRLDNGRLVGAVTSTQRSAGAPVYIGRRSDLDGFEFAGSIDDVRIYSRALSPAEIEADMQGAAVHGEANKPAKSHSWRGPVKADASCAAQSSVDRDAKIPLVAAALGLLVATACVGLWPSAPPLAWLMASLTAAFPLLLVTPATLPSFHLWTIPLLSLAGGAAVVASVRRASGPDDPEATNYRNLRWRRKRDAIAVDGGG